MNLVQFSHGILIAEGDASIVVTKALPDSDPHPAALVNPFAQEDTGDASILATNTAPVPSLVVDTQAIVALTTEAIAALDTDAIPAMSTDAIPAMSTDAAAALTADAAKTVKK